MRTRWVLLTLAALVAGAFGGSLFAPPPAGAVSKEMIELQQQVAQILRGQQDLRSALDTNSATLRTLVQQSLDSVNQLHNQMGTLQKSMQDVQANTGARLDTMTTQTQGLSDNMQDIQARVGKLSQTLNEMQGLLQSIDAKVSSSAPPAVAPPSVQGAPGSLPPGSNAPPSSSNMNPAMPPISADTLYQNGLRDFTSGKYDLAHQEFSDYIRNFPANDLASNCQFYIGEIDYAQGNFKQAIGEYDIVLQNYPKSYKIAASLLKKAFAELELGMKASATRDLRETVRQFPGSDEARRAQAKLHEIGASAAPRSPSR